MQKAFEIFIDKGITESTIQNIVDSAGVAKGTFYLYFKDKSELVESITILKAHELLKTAIDASENQNIKSIKEKVVFIVEYIIDNLTENPKLLKFLYKNLVYGIYEKTLTSPIDEKENSIVDLFIMDTHGVFDKKEAYIKFFLILDLAASSGYNSILYKKPLPIDEYKPYLLSAVRKLMS